MMPSILPYHPKGDAICVTSHDFKTHMAQYLRLMEQDPEIHCIILKQYKRDIAVIMPLDPE